ncbi:MAG: 6-pyruvoyl-tetrahydropterin synthase-related protein, partial [Anaerolineae bacterium]|nr:6-pyruvoyl-tetrahydropterin synthase-related protein [Anaerolineae bacterium]
MIWSRLPHRLDQRLVLVVLLSIFAFAPLTRPGYFVSHSGFLPVFNLYELEDALWGNWGWLPRLATGHDVLSGDGALPYLLAEALRWLGLNGPQAIKAVYVLGFVASGLGMYLLGKRLLGATGALLAAVVYMYLPFHLATVYVRGAFAEAWAFALYPLALLCWERYVSTSKALWAALAVIVFCALASTTMGLALIFALLMAAYALVAGPSRQLKIRALLALALAVSLGVLLQVPALLRYGLPASHQGDFLQHGVYPFQLLSAAWGFGTSVPGWEDTLPLQLGLAATGLSLV